MSPIAHCIFASLEASAFLALALASMPLLRGASAHTRRTILSAALAVALVVPLLSFVAPRVGVGPALSPAAEIMRGTTLDDAKGLSAVTPSPADARVVAAPATRPEAHASRARTLPVLLALAWLAGALGLSARAGLGVVRARGIVRRSRRAPAWTSAYERAARVTSARAAISETTELDAPAVFGFVRPVILVPACASSWSEEQRYAALLHELSHVKSHDCAWKLVARLATAVHFWNPLAWLAARRLRTERELAADDAVVSAGARASAYAADLVSIARAQHAPSGVISMAERSDLAARVERIVAEAPSRVPMSVSRSRALFAGSSLLALGAACASPSAADPAPRAPTTNSARSAAPAASSSIDPAMQSIAEEELSRAVAQWHARAGVILVLDPRTGEVLANAGLENGARADIGVGRAYVTGSTLKMVSLAAAFDAGVLAPRDRIDCEGGKFTYDGQTMTDAEPHGVLAVPDVLAVSSNIGFLKVFDRLGAEKLQRALGAFHLDRAPGIEGAAAGSMPRDVRDKSFAGAVLAIGESLTASPLQLASAYGAIANGGEYVAPTLKKRDGAAASERVVRADTAQRVTEVLEAAVYSEHATGKLAQVTGARVAGKTGTAAYPRADGTEGTYASFVGFAPSAAPRYVVIAGLDEPRDGYGGNSAAPMFARVMTRALAK